jgi:hypothetical protein
MILWSIHWLETSSTCYGERWEGINGSLFAPHLKLYIVLPRHQANHAAYPCSAREPQLHHKAKQAPQLFSRRPWLEEEMVSRRLRKMLTTSLLFRNGKTAAGASPRKIHIAHLWGGMCTPLAPHAPVGVFLHRLDTRTRRNRRISSLASPTPGLAIKLRRSSGTPSLPHLWQ